MSTTGSSPTEVNDVVVSNNLISPFAVPNPLSQTFNTILTPEESNQVADIAPLSPTSRPNPLTQPIGSEGSVPQEDVEVAVVETDLPYGSPNLLVASEPAISFRSSPVRSTTPAPTTTPITPPLQSISIVYSWGGTNEANLNTATTAFEETVGYECGPYDGFYGSQFNQYVKWVSGDVTEVNGYEEVKILIDKARVDGLWNNTYVINGFADWYTPSLGVGPAMMMVRYKNYCKVRMIYPGSSTSCATTPVINIIVYSKVLPDGSFFELVN